MPNNVLLQAPSMTNSNLGWFKLVCDLAKLHGYAGVRTAVGLDNYSIGTTPPTTYVTQGIAYANSIGLTKVAVLLNYDPKPNASYNTPTRPPAGVGNANWTWIATARQSFVDAAHAAKGALVLEFEMSNEQAKGGNRGPKNKTGGYDAPYSTYDNGFLEPAWFAMARFIETLMNYHGNSVVITTLEGEADDSDSNGFGTDAAVEIASWVGADATALAALGTILCYNCYARAPGTPYDAAATKAAFETKCVAEQILIAANPTFNGKTKRLREFGLKRDSMPSCKVPNEIREDLVSQVVNSTTTDEGVMYTALNPSGNPANTDAKFYCYDNLGNPLDGIVVAP